MRLVVGLGNPGTKYSLNRHNVGFMVADALVRDLNCDKINKKSFLGELFRCSDTLVLKPLTYMNLSGKSVAAVKNFYKIPNEKIVVVHDDLDLPFGAVKFKKGGGNGGHNGLKSVDEHIGNDYIRLRVGIGRPQRKEEVVKYVLSDFTPEEIRKLNELIEHITAALKALGEESLEKVASLYSKKGFGPGSG